MADVDLLDFLATRHTHEPLRMEVSRHLSEQDLEDKSGVPAVALEHIRAIHHVQARLVAEGKPPGVVAAKVGTSVARVKSLLADPTFRELVAYYNDQQEYIWQETQEVLSLLGRSAAQELQRRLDEEPSKFTIGELRTVMESAYDRGGAPAQSAGQSIVVSFVKPTGKVIDVEPSA